MVELANKPNRAPCCQWDPQGNCPSGSQLPIDIHVTNLVATNNTEGIAVRSDLLLPGKITFDGVVIDGTTRGPGLSLVGKGTDGTQLVITNMSIRNVAPGAFNPIHFSAGVNNTRIGKYKTSALETPFGGIEMSDVSVSDKHCRPFLGASDMFSCSWWSVNHTRDCHGPSRHSPISLLDIRALYLCCCLLIRTSAAVYPIANVSGSFEVSGKSSSCSIVDHCKADVGRVNVTNWNVSVECSV